MNVSPSTRASAVTKERAPVKLEALLSLAAGQPAAQEWRRRALLEGLAANATARAARPAHASSVEALEPPIAEALSGRKISRNGDGFGMRVGWTALLCRCAGHCRDQHDTGQKCGSQSDHPLSSRMSRFCNGTIARERQAIVQKARP